MENKYFDHIAQSCVAAQGISFTGDDFRSLCWPCVYVLLKGDTALYVGMSRNGMSRITAGLHKQADEARRKCDKVLIYPTVSVDAASRLERVLITGLRPQMNQRGALSSAKLRKLMESQAGDIVAQCT